MADSTTFDLTLERIALIRRMVVAWNPAGQGAPIVHPDAPYGSTDRDGDIFNVTGDDDGADEEHRALGKALAVFLHNAVLKPGRYAYHNTLAKLSSEDVGDVFRDEATGETPEHVTFDVTAEHLALIPKLNLLWDEARDVPAFDTAEPYGVGTELPSVHHEMQPVLQIFLRYGDLAPGLYRRPDGATVWAAV
ncbi:MULTISPECIES: hypothetical protein [unclassified Methylobacterium]|uniref:hypothetical protein n=1 Tax=unclassified Methylobacterium TaxID=2615210 RepID=UPI0006FB8E1C|nr:MULTISPECIES: hypothetical protein [unclassified Methylobacterium]KQO42901.1 hypothetical protein ASF08_09930 [Methylobacterium sp. Leaf85]TXN27099.1 hypothetical protein FV220_12615 [Methylobacterium sp. WL19]